MRVKQQRRMSGLVQIVLRNAELERQMRRAAAEIDAAVELPIRIDQGDARHAKASRLGLLAKRLASHSCSDNSPSCSATFGFQPSAAYSARVSVTYQGWSPGRQFANEYATSFPVSLLSRSISSRRLTA